MQESRIERQRNAGRVIRPQLVQNDKGCGRRQRRENRAMSQSAYEGSNRSSHDGSRDNGVGLRDGNVRQEMQDGQRRQERWYQVEAVLVSCEECERCQQN